MEKSLSQIPFPHGEDSPLIGTKGGMKLPSPGYRDESSKFSFDSAHRRLSSSHSLLSCDTGSQGIQQSIPSATSPASAASSQGESLPSIQNLLHSIGHESAESSSISMRRSPSAPNYSPSSHFATPSEPLPSQHHNHNPFPRSTNASVYMGPQHTERPKTYSWEPPAPPLRSNSPQRRPPLAPSAFAHSQYTHHANSRSDGAIFRPASAMASRASRGPFGSVNQSDVYMKQRSLHSPSSSIPSITSEELQNLPLPSLGAWKPDYEDGAPAAGTKRSIQSQQEMEDASTSPSASRRRHTVGALEEPLGLHNALEQAHRPRKMTADSTPRMASHQHLRAFVSRPESPLTPTSSTMTSRFQGGVRRDSAGSIGGMMASHPSHQRVYMQHASDSLPSLSSSISGTSLSSDRMRVHSLDEYGERRMVPPGWSGAADVLYMEKSAVELPSPRVRGWHSRSSTLDSLDTNSSFAGHHSPYNRPLPPPRTSSLHVDEHGDSATPTRRARDMASPYALAKERTRQNSTRGGEIQRSNSLRTESMHSQPSFSSLDTNVRPRAQTMVYSDRGVPMPSPTSQSVYVSGAASMNGRALSSYSQSSVANLPNRVSSMEINQDAIRMRHPYERNAMPTPSTNSTTTTTNYGNQVNTTTHSTTSSDGSFIAVSGNGHAGGPKYQCGWCGKRFSRPSSLKIHHHSHTGEKPFACTAPNCGRTFSVQSNLRRHQKCHSTQGTAKGPSNEEGPLVGYTRMPEGTTQDERPYQRTSHQNAPPSAFFNNHNHNYPYQQVGVPPSYPSSELAMNYSRQGIPQNGSIRHHNFAASHPDSFMQSREPMASSNSSTAEDEEDELDIGEDEDDNSMQDIREEVVDIAPPHDHSKRSALQGLLN